MGGVEGKKKKKAHSKIYAGAQIRKEKFYGNKEDHHKEDSGKEDRKAADPKDNADMEQRQRFNAHLGNRTQTQK